MAIALTVDIDGEMAAELNQFRPKLEATLILHVGLGKDHFVPVSGSYGMSLSSAVFGALCACVHVGDLRERRCVISADVLREHAHTPDAAQEPHKGGEVYGRPVLRRGGEECPKGSDETRQPHDVW